VKGLLDAYYGNERLINEHCREHCREAYKDVCKSNSDPLFRLILVRNYVAGMTDSYATQQHARLYMSSEHISV
jgi:dGTP triphosphohydrolase